MNMKKCAAGISLWLAVLFLAPVVDMYSISVGESGYTDPEAMVRAYFQSLKQGDTAKLSYLTAGEFRKKKKSWVIEDNNTKYREFLIDYYKDTQLISIQLDPIGEDTLECKMTTLQGNDMITFRLILSFIHHSWRITEELNDRAD